jgi:hypothetical protein
VRMRAYPPLLGLGDGEMHPSPCDAEAEDGACFAMLYLVRVPMGTRYNFATQHDTLISFDRVI